MTPTPNKHDDTKILLIVAGTVVAGAAGIAFLAGMGGEDAEVSKPAVTRAERAERAKPADIEPAVFFDTQETSLEGDSVIETASLRKIGGSTVAAEVDAEALDAETFDIAPGENLVAGGLEAWKSADYVRSAAYFKAQTEARDKDAWAHYMVGLSLWKSGRADEAVAAMRRSAELDPAFIRAAINLSRIENDRGDFEAALSAAQDAVLIDGDHAEARFLEGRSLNNLGQTDAAVAALEKSIELSDANGFAHNLLGLIRLEQGDAERAADALERAAELQPDVAFIHNNLGMALEHCGEREPAVAAYRRAVELDGDSTKAVRNLARLEPATPEPAAETVAAAEDREQGGDSEVVETADAGTR